MEATASLEAKTQLVAELEGKVAALQTSLNEAVAGAQTNGSPIEEVEKAKAAIESELVEVKAALDEARTDSDGGSSLLKSVQEEVCIRPVTRDYKHPNLRSLARRCQVCEYCPDREDSGLAGADRDIGSRGASC